MDINKDSGNYCVYKHTCPNCKVYIGITKRSPEDRWGHNGNGYKGQAFYYAIEKYGWDNIKHEILIDNLSKEKAEQYEILLIKQYGSLIKENGYNVAKGGEIGMDISRGNHPLAIKITIDGKIFDCIKDCADYLGVYRKILSDWLKGKVSMPKKYYDRGLRFLDKESDIHIRETDNGFVSGEKTKVICDNIIFNTIKEFATYYNEDPSNVSKWLQGKIGCPNKYIKMGIRREDGKDLIKEKVSGKMLVKYNGEIFETRKSFCEKYGLDIYDVRGWVKDERKIPSGFEGIEFIKR